MLLMGVALLIKWVWFSIHRMDDQLLEVVGLYSSLHVGKIQVSLGEPLRMGQAKQVKVSQLGTLPHCPVTPFIVLLTDRAKKRSSEL